MHYYNLTDFISYCVVSDGTYPVTRVECTRYKTYLIKTWVLQFSFIMTLNGMPLTLGADF